MELNRLYNKYGQARPSEIQDSDAWQNLTENEFFSSCHGTYPAWKEFFGLLRASSVLPTFFVDSFWKITSQRMTAHVKFFQFLA